MSEEPEGNKLDFERAEVAGGTGSEGAVCALCGTAILGALLWYGVARLTGYEFSLIAIVIGFLVGNAVRLGSRRRGGWLYQALAIFLTYTSIVSTYIPAIYEAAVEQSESAAEAAEVEELAEGEIPTLAASAADASGEADGVPETATDPQPVEAAAVVGPASAAPPVGLVGGVAGLLLGLTALFAIAFAAPFLGGFSNFMGWIILAIGLYEAWKTNRREEVVIEGPFRVAGAPPAYVPEVPPPPIAP